MENKAEIAQRTYDMIQARKRRKEQIENNIKNDVVAVMIESRKRHRWGKTKQW